MIHKPNLYALTGGPGAGKTTLLRALAARGEACLDESARAVIQAEIAAGRPRPVGLPFCELMLARDVVAFHAAGSERAFLDRSLVDAWATAKACGIRQWPQGEAAVRTLRYSARAFIFPPWKAIYREDAERIQTWAEAVSAYESCAEAYAAAGYELMEVPRLGVEGRVEFVLASAAQVSTNAFSSTKSPGAAIEPST
jgi:predicted ATPase